MKKQLAVIAVALLLPVVASAQGSDRGQQKREEQHQRRVAQQAQRAEDRAQRNEAKARRQRAGNVWIPSRPLVLRDGKRWVAPVYGRNDLRLEHPWQQGRFNRGIGPAYVWQLRDGNRERFNIGGRWFALAPADYTHAGDWRWSSDDVVLYPDRDHDGWYLAYNVRTGQYLHARYLGD